MKCAVLVPSLIKMPRLTLARTLPCFLFVIYCIRTCASSTCNTISNVGREFYIGLSYVNETDVIYAYSINILSGQDGTAFIQAPAFHINKSYSLMTGHNTVRFENQNADPTLLTTYAAVLHLISDIDISVSVFLYGRKYRIADTYLALPSDALSTEYVIASSRPIRQFLKNQILIIGTKQNTSVILPMGLQKTIGRYEAVVLEGIDGMDSSGMTITATEPVAVFSASKAAFVPDYFSSHYGAEPNIEMMLPKEFGGNFFIVPPLPGRNNYLVKVFPLYKETYLQLRNKSVSTDATIDRFTQFVFGDDYVNIKANKPVLVYQYAFSSGNNNPDYKGTFLRSVSANEHFISSAIFVVQSYERNIKNYLQIVTDNPELVFIDGINIRNYTSNNIGTLLTDTHMSHFIFYSTSIFSVSMDDPPFNNNGLHKIYSVGKARFSAMIAGYASHQQSAYGQQLAMQYTKCANILETTTQASTKTSTTTTSIRPTASTSPITITTTETSTTMSMTTSTTTLSTTLSTNQTSAKGPLCLQCDDLTHLFLCNNFVRCSSSQVCFLDRYINIADQARFNMGCREEKLCHDNDDQANDAIKHKRQTTCRQCCNGNFCNIKGCGAEKFPAGVQHGPACLTCHHALNVDECNTLEYCQQDEVCSIRVSEWFPGLNQLKLECANKQCLGFRSMSVRRRSSILCEHCCSGDFCNQECTTPDPAIVVG